MAKIQKLPDTTLSMEPERDDIQQPFRINILDILLVLVRYRMLIIIMMLLFGFMGFQGSLGLKNIYRSEATLMPRQMNKSMFSLSALGGLGGMVADQLGLGGSGTADKLELVLRSRYLSGRMIEKYNLLPELFPERLKKKKIKKKPGLLSSFFKLFQSDDAQNKKKIKKRRRRPITVQDGQKRMKGVLKVYANKKKRTIKVSAEHREPLMARKIVDYAVTELSMILREEVLRDARDNIRFFKEQIDKAGDPLLRDKIYVMLAAEIEKETFALAQRYYGFVVVDPPVVPDLSKKVRPNRPKMIVMRAFLGIFFGIFLAMAIEFFRRARAKDPVRFARFMDELKFRVKGKKG